MVGRTTGNKGNLPVGPNPTSMLGEMSRPLPSPHVPMTHWIQKEFGGYMTLDLQQVSLSLWFLSSF